MPPYLLLLSGASGIAVGVEAVSVASGPAELELSRLTIGRVSVNDELGGVLALSAKRGGTAALQLLFREFGRNFPIARLEIQTGALLASVTGRSSELLFGLEVFLNLARQDRLIGLQGHAFAATGTLDVEGNVGSVEGVTAKISAAIDSDLAAGSFVFYPRANDGEVSPDQRQRCVARGLVLKPVDQLEEALIALGVTINGRWVDTPYRSLEAFERQHSRIFFGRQGEIRQLVEQLETRAAAGRPGALVIGGSGSGKSSFCMAGVLPALERLSPSLEHAVWRPRDAIPASRSETITEADIALSILANWQLRDAKNGAGFSIATSLPDTATLAALSSELTEDTLASRRHVWIIDQFEELFTLGFSTEAQIAFARFLSHLQARGIWVIATLRNEFFNRYQDLHDGNIAALTEVFGTNGGEFKLARMGRDALRQVIVIPAELAGLKFETRGSDNSRLDDVILADAMDTADVLPLLEFTLQLLYDGLARTEPQGDATTEQPRLLTFAAYEALGGINGAIGKIVKPTFAALDAETKAALPGLLDALAVPAADGQRETARPAAFDQWPPGSPEGNLIDALVGIRVLVSDDSGHPGAGAQVRVAHEALFTHWPEAAAILQESRQTRLIIEDFRQRAETWDKDGRPDGGLLAAPKDIELARAIQDHMPDNRQYGTTNTFLISSTALAAAKVVDQRNRLRLLVVLALATISVLFGLSWWAILQRAEAITQRLSAEKQTALSSQKTQEALVALERRNIAISDAQRERASAELQTRKAIAAGLGESKQRYVAEQNAASAQNTLARLFYVNGSRALDIGKPVLAMRYALAGDRISIENRRLYEVVLARSLSLMENSQIIGSHNIGSKRALFNANEKEIASIEEYGNFRFWGSDGRTIRDISTAQLGESRPQKISSGMILSASNDGSTTIYYKTDLGFSSTLNCFVLSDASGHLSCWTSSGLRNRFDREGLLIGSSPQFISRENSVVIMPIDRNDRCYHLMSLRTMKYFGNPISCNMSLMLSAAFSPNGNRLATALWEGEISISDATTGKFITKLDHQNRSEVRSLAFSPDGATISAALGNNTVAFWNSSTGDRSMPPIQVGNDVETIDFSHDGSRIATAGKGDYAIRIWSARTGERLGFPIFGHEDGIRSIAFSKDDSQILSAGDDGAVRISKIDEVTSWDHRLFHDTGWTHTFSGDGRLMVDENENDEVEYGILCKNKFVSGSIKGNIGSRDESALSNGCDKLLIGMQDRALIVSPVTGLIQSTLQGYLDGQGLAAFSPRGNLVAVAKLGGIGRIWDTKTGRQVGKKIEGNLHFPHNILFSPDGKSILVNSSISGGGSRIRIFDALTGSGIGNAVITNRSPSDTAVFSPDGSFILTGGWDGRAYVWNWRTGVQVGATLIGHTGRINMVSFSPNGSWVATSSSDATIRLWNARTGLPTGVVIRTPGGISRIEVSSDSRRILSVSRGDTTSSVQIWDSLTGSEIGPAYEARSFDMTGTFGEKGDEIITTVRKEENKIVWSRYATRARLEDWATLASLACLRVMGPKARRFSKSEIDADPLLLRLWPSHSRDVCL